MKIEQGYNPAADEEPNCLRTKMEFAAFVGFLAGISLTLIAGALIAAYQH